MNKGTESSETQRSEAKIFGDFLEAIVAQPEGTVNSYIHLATWETQPNPGSSPHLNGVGIQKGMALEYLPAMDFILRR